MKQIIKIILLGILIVPCLLVFNEGASIVPNLIGFAYITLLYLILRHTRFLNGVARFVKRTIEKEDREDIF